MEEDLIKRLHSARLIQGEMRALAVRLPAADEDLHRLIESLVASADEVGVTALMSHEICRVRAAGDYRLLFKLQPQKNRNP